MSFLPSVNRRLRRFAQTR